MKLSPQTLTLGPVAYGGCAQAQHSQWGNVTLEADGRVDDAFTPAQFMNHMTGEPVAKFLVAEQQLSISSKQVALEEFEAGRKCEQQILSDTHRKILTQALKDSGLNGYVYSSTDWRGVMTGCTVQLNDYAQTLEVEHGKEGTEAVLTSYVKDGTHVIHCPVDSRGHVDLGACTEQLTLNVPWLSKPVIEDQGKNAITSMQDPRLERLTEAAQLGFLVAADEMGPGWKSTVEGGVQVLSPEHSDERITLDPKARSLTITASGWVSHGERDSHIQDKIVFQGGKFSKSR